MDGKFFQSYLQIDNYQLEPIVRIVLPRAIACGLLTAEDMKFLRLWGSGTYFQSAPVPVLFPFDKSVSDVAESTKRNNRFHYYDDIEISYDGVKYRLLRLVGTGALAVLVKWLKDRGVTDDELKLQYARGDGVPDTLDLGTNPITIPKMRCRGVHYHAISKGEADSRMGEIPKLSNGAVPAKRLMKAFSAQMKKHNYTTRTFAAGTGLPLPFVRKWLKGELLIRPNELRKICDQFGVENLFEGISVRD